MKSSQCPLRPNERQVVFASCLSFWADLTTPNSLASRPSARQNGWTSRSRITWVAPARGYRGAPSHQREDWSNEKESTLCRFGCTPGYDLHRRGGEWAGACAVVGEIPADGWLLLKVLDRLGPKSRLRVCYEAGPTGYGLARQLNEQGICCVVVAPSLVPIQKNRRIKTDRRDAVRLAHFLRSGDLVEVSIPQAQTEAMRDLERAREDAIQVEHVARQQLDKFLLRHGRRWSAGGKWTHKHWQWIKVQEFSEEASRRVFNDYLHTVEQALARVQRLTADN